MHFKVRLMFAALAVLSVTSCQNKSAESTTTETLPAETVATTADADQVFAIAPSASTIHWEAYKPAMGVTHTGTVNVSQGNVMIKNGMITQGSFVIDFTTIKNTDLQGNSKDKLEAHLKGTASGKEDDFFNINKYPTGKFEITNVTSIEGDADANLLIYGNLTIKDITKNIGFKAKAGMQNTTLIVTTPLFQLDRTEWGIKVLSKKFFQDLKDGFVSDEFGLRIELRADAGPDI